MKIYKPNITLKTIREYEIFITKKESELLLNIAQSANEEDWFNGNPEDSWYGKFLLIGNNNVLSGIHSKIQSIFDSSWKVNKIDRIQRFNYDLPTIGRHSDEIGHPEIRYGAIVYLNDNYLGGEIVYPDLNIEIKPKAQSLILHPGGVDHFVNPIKSKNTRYMLTTFIHHPELTEWSFNNDS